MLDKALKEMNNIIEASVIVSKDGLLISSNVTKKWNAEIAVLICATILEAAERAITDLGNGTPDRVIVESIQGKIILTEAGAKALLAIMTKPEADFGLVMDELANPKERIKQILG